MGDAAFVIFAKNDKVLSAQFLENQGFYLNKLSCSRAACWDQKSPLLGCAHFVGHEQVGYLFIC